MNVKKLANLIKEKKKQIKSGVKPDENLESKIEVLKSEIKELENHKKLEDRH